VDTRTTEDEIAFSIVMAVTFGGRPASRRLKSALRTVTTAYMPSIEGLHAPLLQERRQVAQDPGVARPGGGPVEYVRQVGAAERRPAGTDHWGGPADQPRLYNTARPTSFPAGASFGTIAAMGPASLADTMRSYQQSMQL